MIQLTRINIINTENIRIIWTDTETKEEKEIFSANTSLAGLWHLKEIIKTEMKKAAGCKVDDTYDYLNQIEHLKRSAILLVISECNWNKKEAAKKLGINRTTLHETINRYAISENMPLPDLLNHNYIDSLINNISDSLLKSEMELITKREVSKAREIAANLLKKLQQKERKINESISNEGTRHNNL